MDEKRSLDRVENLVREALSGLGLLKGLASRVLMGMPSREEMKPELGAGLRTAFALMAVVFTAAYWVTDLPRWFGAGPAVSRLSIGLATFGTVLGCLAIALSLGLRERKEEGTDRKRTTQALRAARQFAGLPEARALFGTLIACAFLAAAWAGLDYFPEHFYFTKALRAARASTFSLMLVLALLAGVQALLLARRHQPRAVLRWVQAAGLVAVAVACTANYLIFVT